VSRGTWHSLSLSRQGQNWSVVFLCKSLFTILMVCASLEFSGLSVNAGGGLTKKGRPRWARRPLCTNLAEHIDDGRTMATARLPGGKTPGLIDALMTSLICHYVASLLGDVPATTWSVVQRTSGHWPTTERLADRPGSVPSSLELSVIHYMLDGRWGWLSRNEMSSQVPPVYLPTWEWARHYSHSSLSQTH